MNPGFLEEFTFLKFSVPTELGKCRMLNFCDRNKFLRDEANDGRVLGIGIVHQSNKLVADNQPYTTTSLELGADLKIYSLDYEEDDDENLTPRSNDPFILMIHSPFEMPTRENQKFLIVDMDHETFFVTPQLNRIDDTMIDMEPHE